MMRVARNTPCPCGSSLKFKHCHGRFGNETWPPQEVLRQLARHQAAERNREALQGQGRGMVSLKTSGHQVVAVGDTLHFSSTWKTFPDFLNYFLKNKLGEFWGPAELSKPAEERHPVLHWHEAICQTQAATRKEVNEIVSTPMNGAMACYYSLAYGLYLLQHNVELQERLLSRIRIRDQFQGAYYEVLVASAFIRAGFELKLEDETDTRSKHCEFAAVSRVSGKTYSVEVKTRGIAGVLGRTNVDGGASSKPLGKMIHHLNQALKKPAPEERMVFIDINTPLTGTGSDSGPPSILKRAFNRLESYEKEKGEKVERAYVFITNLAFHYDLAGPPNWSVMPFGLGISSQRESPTLANEVNEDADKIHLDAFRVVGALQKGLNLPMTFDN